MTLLPLCVFSWPLQLTVFCDVHRYTHFRPENYSIANPERESDPVSKACRCIFIHCLDHKVAILQCTKARQETARCVLWYEPSLD